jgi:hypothetical protein
MFVPVRDRLRLTLHCRAESVTLYNSAVLSEAVASCALQYSAVQDSSREQALLQTPLTCAA